MQNATGIMVIQRHRNRSVHDLFLRNRFFPQNEPSQRYGWEHLTCLLQQWASWYPTVMVSIIKTGWEISSDNNNIHMGDCTAASEVNKKISYSIRGLHIYDSGAKVTADTAIISDMRPVVFAGNRGQPGKIAWINDLELMATKQSLKCQVRNINTTYW